MMSLEQFFQFVDKEGRVVVLRDSGRAYVAHRLETNSDCRKDSREPRRSGIDGVANIADLENDIVTGLTREELLDRINRDIELWKAGQGDHTVDNLDDEEYSGDSELYLEPV